MGDNSAFSLEKKIATEILNGASTADIAEINSLSYPSCRQHLHRYCMRVNKKMYEELCIRAAHDEVCSPTMAMLRNNKDAFLPKVICSGRTIQELEDDLKQISEEGRQRQLAWRKSRANIKQLQQQLKTMRRQQMQ